MSEEMKKFIKYYSPVFIICLMLLCWLMYYYLFLDSKISITTAYLDDATYSENETFFIEVNYYSNENENGQEVFEVKFNYYTDTRIPEKDEDGNFEAKYMYSTGAQFLGGIQYTYKEDTSISELFSNRADHYYTLKNGYYYDTEMGGTSFTSLKGQSLINQSSWLFDVNGELCKIWCKYLDEKNLDDMFIEKTLWINHYLKIDTSYFILSLYNTIQSLDEGEKIFALNLSDYFYVNIQNDDGTFNTQPTDDENYLYANIKVNVNNNGMINANQSLFGIVEEDADWSLYGSNSDEYWQVRTEYNLTLNDFIVVSESQKFYLDIKQSCLNYLKPFNYLNIIITINLDEVKVASTQVDIQGFTQKLYSLDIYKIILHSTTEREFEILDKDIQIEKDNIISITYPQEVQYA